jgi:CDP-glucose 4,6-dehydratase
MVMESKNILITGATGLIGSHLIEELDADDKHNIVILQRDDIPYSYLWDIQNIRDRIYIVRGDFRDFDLVKRALNEYDINLVFHLGAQPIVGTAVKDARSTIEQNIMGTTNILQSVLELRDRGLYIQTIVASSDKAYGVMESRTTPYTEDMPLAGIYPYDCSKSCVDLISQMYRETYHLPITIARCGNTFGPGDMNFNRLIPGVIKAKLNKEAFAVRSNGIAVRDYIYVNDVVDGYLAIADAMDMRKKLPPAFNISTGNHLSVTQVIDAVTELIVDAKLYPVQLSTNPAVNEIPFQTLSSKLIEDTLGFKSVYSFKQALLETIKWYTQINQT